MNERLNINTKIVKEFEVSKKGQLFGKEKLPQS